MRRLAQSRNSLLFTTQCRPPASQPYNVRGKSDDAKAAASQAGTKSSELDPEDLSGFDFGFDNWSEINTREKTVTTAAGQLPISPLLDPAWREARLRKKKKTPKANATHNRFQRRVEENIFAQFLAEPVRNCPITRTRLPRSFLQSFGIVTHPETHERWWIPGDFEQAPSKSGTEAPGENESSAADEQLDSTESGPVDGSQESAARQSVVVAADKPSSSPDAALDSTPASEAETIEGDTVAAAGSAGSQQGPPKKINGKFFAPAHMIARQDLMLEFFDKGSKFNSGYMRFASNPNLGKFCKDAIWRQDMHEVIRDQMRREIVDGLVYLWGLCQAKDRDYLIKVDSLEDFKSDWNRFCCLFLGERELEPFEILDVPDTAANAVPGYDLPMLLGPDSLNTLRSKVTVFQNATIVVVKGKRTLDLSKKLWRLQGFVADYKKLL